MSALADAIRAGLRDAGLSQVQLASMLGVIPNTVSKWVNAGTVPGSADAGILAHLLDRPEIATLADDARGDQSERASRAWETRRANRPTDAQRPAPREPKRRTLDVWSLRPPARNATHLVEDIRFAPGAPQDKAPVSCRCGWSGTAGEWLGHQKAIEA